MAGTDLVPVDELKDMYPVLGDAETREALEVNLGGDDAMTVFDLDRVKIPAGGGVNWEVPGLDGPDAVKKLRGVIVGIIKRRSFWETSLDEQSEPSPPDCSSDDAVFGKGVFGVGSEEHPSGKCADCPMNQFQEVKGRNTKPCSEQRLVLFLREESLLPIVVQLPPTSMRELRSYMMRLANSKIPYYRAITELTLKKVDGTPAYSVAVAGLGGQIDGESAAVLKKLGDDVVAAYNAAANSGNASTVADAKVVEATGKAK